MNYGFIFSLVMKFNLQYLPFYSNDPIPKRPNSPNASTISFGSLNDFLANQSTTNLSESNLEMAPYTTTNPTNFQPLSTPPKSRFSL